jgi:hypothetical protein
MNTTPTTITGTTPPTIVDNNNPPTIGMTVIPTIITTTATPTMIDSTTIPPNINNNARPPTINANTTLQMGVCQNATAPKLSLRIDKNAIIAKYDEDCHKIGYSNQVTTVKKGEPTNPPTTYPTIFQLVHD